MVCSSLLILFIPFYLLMFFFTISQIRIFCVEEGLNAFFAQIFDKPTIHVGWWFLIIFIFLLLLFITVFGYIYSRNSIIKDKLMIVSINASEIHEWVDKPISQVENFLYEKARKKSRHEIWVPKFIRKNIRWFGKKTYSENVGDKAEYSFENWYRKTHQKELISQFSVWNDNLSGRIDFKDDQHIYEIKATSYFNPEQLYEEKWKYQLATYLFLTKYKKGFVYVYDSKNEENLITKFELSYDDEIVSKISLLNDNIQKIKINK